MGWKKFVQSSSYEESSVSLEKGMALGSQMRKLGWRE